MIHMSFNVLNWMMADTKSPESAMEGVLPVLDAVDLMESEVP
jgi:hypothetical protein